jgi:hypothetical protein
MRRVHLRRDVAIQTEMFHGADDTDDLLRNAGPNQSRTNRIAVRPECRGHALVDDHDRLRRLDVARRERAPAHKRNAHRREVVGVTERLGARLLPQIEEVHWRQIAWKASRCSALHVDELRRIGIWQGCEENRVNDGKNCGVRASPEGEPTSAKPGRLTSDRTA